jgi:hypothetical protein
VDLALGRFPAYPVAIAAAFILNLFTETWASVAAVPRPLLIAVSIAVALQAVFTLLARDRDRGAFWAAIVLLLAAGLSPLAVLVGGLPAAVLLARLITTRRVEALPWRRMTALLNVLVLVVLVTSVVQGWLAGAYRSFGPPDRATATQDARTGPDVYLILLDGYPRADTLAAEFSYDNGPFLAEMASLGFDVATEARSNYNITTLTLASMLNAAHVRDLPGLPVEPQRVQAQNRALTASINRAAALDGFRERGYEIVTVRSPFTHVALMSADRRLNSDDVTAFEIALIGALGTRAVLTDLQRRWFSDSIRDRSLDAFDQTVALAAERGGPPKFVFTHILSPHPPILFAGDGAPMDTWPCFPEECSPWDPGDRYGAAIDPLVAGQVNHLNQLVLDSIRRIQAASHVPPVIVVFSDHGHRHEYGNHDEMFRSLLLTNTPGQPGLFPTDATPINILPRIRNAYHDAGLPLATEESYFTDMHTVNSLGPLPVSTEPFVVAE